MTSFVVAVLAAWQRGLSIVLPPNTRMRTLDEIRQRAKVCAEIIEDDPRLVIDPAPSDEGLGLNLDPEQPLATVYTSGSTGTHDDVCKSAAQLLGEAEVLASTFELCASTRVLTTVPPHHIYGLLFGVLAPLVCGGSVIAHVPFHAAAVEEVARAFRATALVSTPAHLRGLAVLDIGAVPTIVRVFSSGASLPSVTAAQVRNRFGCSVTEVLGSTETGGIAWREADGSEDIAWRPLPGVRVQANSEGRMLLCSPFLPALAVQPYAADDQIELRRSVSGEDTFRHLGRLDDVIKVGGKRISLSVLESRLRALPGVQDAAVVAEPAPNGHDRRLRAAVVAPSLDAEVLRKALLEWFDPVLVPRKLVLVDALPRESTGKLRRAALTNLLDERG